MNPHQTLLLAVLCAMPVACNDQHPESESFFASAFPDRHPEEFPTMSSSATLREAPPMVGEDIFPCSECHDPDFMDTDPERRELEDPHDLLAPLAHGNDRLWCLDCHDADNRDLLHLASGETLPFAEAPRLCGQCHGEKYRDWIGGAHGKRTGSWDDSAPKEVWVCANCHNAHTPQFGTIEPMPAPQRPELNR